MHDVRSLEFAALDDYLAFRVVDAAAMYGHSSSYPFSPREAANQILIGFQMDTFDSSLGNRYLLVT